MQNMSNTRVKPTRDGSSSDPRFCSFAHYAHRWAVTENCMRTLAPEKATLVEKHMKRLRNLVRRPICLAHGECSGNIGRSHTISKSQSLSLIAENDHVLTRNINLFATSENELLEFKNTSINEALAFPGFCNLHDRNLFKSLDNSQFIATQEQLFMQAYRCACREYYFKACQIDAFLDANEIAELQGLPTDQQYKLSPEHEIIKLSMEAGMYDAIFMKNKFEMHLSHKEFRRLQSHVMNFTNTPVLACAGSFFPDYLANGKLLQDPIAFDKQMQSLFISVMPDKSGLFVLFSFFDDESRAPIHFIEDLITTNSLTSRILWMCMTRLENLAFKPSWWFGLSNEARSKINEAVHYNADVFDTRLPTFDRMPDFGIEEWEIRHQFWI
jgi:hypothetical protein